MGVADEKLVDLAVEVFNDELDHWKRYGTHQHGMTMLQRQRPFRITDGPEIPAETETIERHMIPDRYVIDFLRERAMAKVIDALVEQLAAT
jgi:hypothetical protein